MLKRNGVDLPPGFSIMVSWHLYLSFTKDRMAILEYCRLMKRKQVSCIKVYSKTKKIKKNIKWLYDENIRLLLQEKAEKLKVRDRA